MEDRFLKPAGDKRGSSFKKTGYPKTSARRSDSSDRGAGSTQRSGGYRSLSSDRAPRREFSSDRSPRREFGDRSERSSGFRSSSFDRPQRSGGFRSQSSDRAPRREFGSARPQRMGFGEEKVERSTEFSRPVRSERPRREGNFRSSSSDRAPRREFSSDRSPRREFGDRSERSSGFRSSSFDRPQRSEGSKSGGYDRGGRSSDRRGGYDRNGRSRSSQGRRPNEKSIPIHKLISVPTEQDTSVKIDFKPTFKYEDLPLNETLKKNIKEKGYVNPSPIQDQAIPAILVGQDVVGIADTGSGKTAAFLIPLINKTCKNPNEKTIIVTPTRELATQINDEFRALSKNLRQFSIVSIGGTDVRNQVFYLKRNFNFVIGTPGRLLDLIRTGNLKLNEFTSLVLDEVDRMLDMGFIDDVEEIISKLHKDRQTLFFSATTSKEIENLMKKFLAQDSARISVKKQDTNKNIHQDIVEVSRDQKKSEILTKILSGEEVIKTLVFVRTKRYADELADDLYNNGFKVATLHGDKSQSKRKQALNQFRENRVNILVATDVAARGLDIPDVSHVINYDMPATYEDYIHRIGRTGRMNNKGYALTFVPAGSSRTKSR